MRNKLSPHNFIVLLLCLLAFAFSAVLSRTVFERLPHLEDEYAYTFQARTIARGDLVIEQPQPRRAYWQPFVVDKDGLRFSKYTPGWGMLLATGTVMGQEWVVNAFLAAMTVALVYAIARDLFGRDTGLIAAALTAFSPIAMLLNATLMGHTAAMFAGVLALWAYLQFEKRIAASFKPQATSPTFPPSPKTEGLIEDTERGQGGEVSKSSALGTSLRLGAWGLPLLCGLALGLVAANRPITAVAFALPLVVRAVSNLLASWRLGGSIGYVFPVLRPHLVIAVAALAIAAIIPIYNYAAVGDPTANLYKLVWEYDCVGFEGCGRSGHTLEKAFRHTRFDLSVTAADLFGWQTEPLNEAARAHLLTESDAYPQYGMSWILLPFGLLIGLRRRWWLGVLWVVVIFAAYQFAMDFDGGSLLTNPNFAWAWVFGSIAVTVLPIAALRDRRASWTWILMATAAILIALQLTYWIGSQRYSTRYYFEGLAAAAILSALPLAWLLKQLTLRLRAFASLRYVSVVFYIAFAAVLVYTLYAYTLPRLDVLRGYNQITRDLIDQVNARREGDTPVLVLVTGGDVRWRAYGALMASTSPYLDSPIVAAWDYSNGTNPDIRADILARFPDRQVIEMGADVNESWFLDETP